MLACTPTEHWPPCWALLRLSPCSLTAEEALERVQRAFDTRQDGGRRSPETDAQYEFVRAVVAQQQQQQQQQ